MDPSARPARGRGRPAGTGLVDDEELLHRALQALAHGGYRGLSMRELARSFGVSLRSIQHRHATKDELWRAAIDHATAPVTVGGGAGDLATVLRTRLAEAEVYPGLVSSLLADDSPGHEERLCYLLERLAPWFTAARADLAAAGGAGLARDIDGAVLIATMLVAVGSMGALPSQLCEALGLGDNPQQRLADGLADVILFGVVARD